MAEYYHETFTKRPRIDSSHVRHVNSEHVMSRSRVIEHHGSGNKYFKFPNEKCDARYENMQGLARKRRMNQQHKPRTTQDVWDKGYNSTSRDAPKSDVVNCTGDDVGKTKAVGKDGPREKQRLTQDLERQRKKLKEDMERGQELQREHSQLLTRDAPRDMMQDSPRNMMHLSRSIRDQDTKDDGSTTTNFEAHEISARHKIRHLSSDHRGTAECSETEEDAREDGDIKMKKERCESKNEKRTREQLHSDVKDQLLQGNLDPCNCEDNMTSSGHAFHEQLQRISEAQCEHSTLRDNEAIHNGSISGEHQSPCETAEEFYTSEKIEVIGESEDVSEKHKSKKHDGKNRTSFEKNNRNEKRQKSHGGKTAEVLFDFSGSQSARRGKEGRCGSVDEEFLNETSSGNKRNSCSDTESHDVEHGGNKPHENKMNIVQEENSKLLSELENEITQNRVRSDFPRHNWLVERWMKQKYSLASGDKNRSSSGEDFNENKEGAPKSTSLECCGSTTVTRACVTNAVFEDKYEDEVLEEGYTKRTSNDDQDEDYEAAEQENHNSADLRLLVEVKSEQNVTRHSPETQYPAHNNEEFSSQERNRTSSEIKQLPPNQVSPSAKTPNRFPSLSSAPQIERKSVSPLHESRGNEELAENHGDSRTKGDTERERENTKISVKDEKEDLRKRCEKQESNFSGISTTKESGKITETATESEENKPDREKEYSKIQTGKSVNPVSPIVRADRHTMDEINTARHQGMKPLRVPPDLPPALPFVGSGYLAGYPPRTFTPHLITHTAAGMSAPVSPVMHHPGHRALHDPYSGRLEFARSAKTDINCPFHGRKPTEKAGIQHMPRHPVFPGDHHILPRHLLHEKFTDIAVKTCDKRPENADFPASSAGMHRHFPALYDRHPFMQHGIHIHHPGYLNSAVADEYGYVVDNDRFKLRFDASHAYALHRSQLHPSRGATEDCRHTSKGDVSPSRYVELPVRDKRDSVKDFGPSPAISQKQGCSPHQSDLTKTTEPKKLMTSDSEKRSNDITRKSFISQQEISSLKREHASRMRQGSPGKGGQHSTRDTNPPRDYYPGFIQLGEDISKKRTGNDISLFKPNSSPSALDREAISRDFSERFNILDKTFKEKMEGTDSSSDILSSYKDSAQPRHVFELGNPGLKTKTWDENVWKIDSHKNKTREQHSPGARHSSPGHDEHRISIKANSPRGLGSSSSNKQAMLTSAYRYHGGTVSSSPGLHGMKGREDAERGVERVPMMGNYGEYMFTPWHGLNTRCHLPIYNPATTLPPEKNEPLKYGHVTGKREQEDQELSLAIEKHRMNLAQLENERRKAFVVNDSIPMTAKFERKNERRPESSERQPASPRIKTDEMQKRWEQADVGKRKFEERTQDTREFPKERSPRSDLLNRMTNKPYLAEEFALRKEHIPLYPTHPDLYTHHSPRLPYPDRGGGSAGTPFYTSRYDVERSKAEHSVTEALRKQREYNERQEAMKKTLSCEREENSEPAKKRTKNVQCTCGVCGKRASFLCSGCQRAWYCSAKCQHAAWVEHSKECTETRRR